jgi:acetyl-CoA carboxylase alpha subunit
MGKYIEMLLYMQDDTQWCEPESQEEIEKNMDIFEKSKMARRKRRGSTMANYMDKILYDDEEYQPKEFSKDDVIHDIMLAGLEKIAQSKSHEKAVEIAEDRLERVKEIREKGDGENIK